MGLATKVFRACTAFVYVPLSWKVFRVACRPKLGHTNHILAKSFHPLSFTFLLKILEKLVDRHVREGALVEYPVHPLNMHTDCSASL
jgi:hypothetical protein